MSNDLTSTPNLWVLTEPGILSLTPVWIRKIIYIPNAEDNDLQFKQWDSNTTVAAGSLFLKTGTISSTNTLTSTGNLPSSIADGHVFRIVASSGDTDNIGYHVVETAGDANAVVIHGDDWADESDKVYSWETYATVTAMVYKAGATDASPIRDNFTPPKRFPNLTLEIIDGGTAYVYLY
jgi:hypothetical protein